MARTLTVVCRRDSSKDRLNGTVPFEGYQFLWPDGRPLVVGLDALCQHGQRLFGLGRHLEGRLERLIQLTCFPLTSRDDDLNRIPGHRVRRFFLERLGKIGRIHFMDGTPTTVIFEMGKDEPRVLHWVGLPSLGEGDRQWFDLSAFPVETPEGSAGGVVGRRTREGSSILISGREAGEEFSAHTY